MTYDMLRIWILDDDNKRNTDKVYTGIFNIKDKEHPFTNKNTTQKKLTELLNKMDPKARAVYKKHLKSDIESEIDAEVEKNNKEWAKELNAKIAAARDDADFRVIEQRIKTDRKNDESEYEDRTAKTVKENLDNAWGKEDIKKIKEATKQSDLADISFRGREAVREAWQDKQKELKTLDEEFRDAVKSSDSISELRSMRRDAPTISAEEELDKRIEELEDGNES